MLSNSVIESSFMTGQLNLDAIVIDILKYNNGYIIITDNSPFYPENYKWGDQKSDVGIIAFSTHILNIVKTYTAAIIDGQIYIGQNIPNKLNSEDKLIPAHYLESLNGLEEKVIIDKKIIIGKKVELSVDAEVRHKISVAHSMAHFMSLALNKAANKYWNKNYDTDSLGNFNLDKASIFKSSISELQSVDIYRFGKSIKKKGFDKTAFLQDINRVNEEINLTLKNWLSTGREIQVEYISKNIEDLRLWKSTVENHPVVIPCGGTHIKNTEEIGDFKVEISLGESDEYVVITTHCQLRS
ncbi:hypothetical protein [Xenorhabdus thuongxuanensis]|uniref:Threonyl/alanyl tRNA synthetase SAD domain-containing protein n=1 Tax=Xenorhabdus thuongxuanensis TaxID=1873484 RepID=A0A1Q5U0Z7_9GAMM|nr:hypothetical protein [Xenorhabdus thuongxuanensis]OKP06146.1 hypothetical protein Xentx_02285 [Xenorhabdus thuongxuanensis]